MTIEHTPQCDKITCKAFGMNRQAVPVSGTGHALVDLAGVARVKAHGEIAHRHPRRQLETYIPGKQTND